MEVVVAKETKEAPSAAPEQGTAYSHQLEAKNFELEQEVLKLRTEKKRLTVAGESLQVKTDSLKASLDSTHQQLGNYKQLVHLVRRHRVGVLQHRADPCFTQKTLLLNRILGEFRQQRFITNHSPQMHIFA